jgi:hypothetical protein
MALHNPFRYKDWFNTDGEGATDTGDDVEVGRENIPDDRDATIILANTPENAAFMGIFAGVTLEDGGDSGKPNSPPRCAGHRSNMAEVRTRGELALAVFAIPALVFTGCPSILGSEW